MRKDYEQFARLSKVSTNCGRIYMICGENMQILEVKDRNNILINQLETLWEASVKATHLFLADKDISEIKKIIPKALKSISVLIVAYKADVPVAFMGIEDKKLEMLFISPEEIGKGLGKKLVEYGTRHYSICEISVNEQNPKAVGFYEHLGFETYKRTETDEQGNPFPILYMRL